MPTLDLNGDGRVYWEAGPERYASLGRTSLYLFLGLKDQIGLLIYLNIYLKDGRRVLVMRMLVLIEV